MLQHSGEIGRLPLTDTPSGWTPLGQMHVIGKRLSADLVCWFGAMIVGAGFTGLAAVRRLGELNPGQRIALIDTLPAGWGRSGRSSGFIIDLLNDIYTASDMPAMNPPALFPGLGVRARLKMAAWESRKEI